MLEAPIRQRPVFRTVESAAQLPSGLGAVGISLLRLRLQRRDLPIGRIDNQRSPPAAHDLSAIAPKFVIGADDIGIGRPIAAIAVGLVNRFLGVLESFAFGKKLFGGEVRRALQRRNRHVGPNALQIRLLVRRAWRRPCFNT